MYEEALVAVLGMARFAKERELIWHGIVAMSSPWMTTEQPPDGKVQTFQDSMLLDGFDGIL